MSEKKTFYWIQPAKSKKWHIHAGDGISLCGKWLMTNTDEEVSGNVEFNDGDCKVCVRKYRELVEQVED